MAYYRVSTQRQGISGLGLDAQRASVERYMAANALALEAAYTEIETGTRKRRRVEIHRAIKHARKVGAVLLIAKLDRLARNVAFISALIEGGVEFRAVDMPQADKLTIHLMAAMAEHEAEMISRRTREALAQAKARGVKLGKPENLSEAARLKGARRNREQALRSYQPVRGYVTLLRDQGLSYRAIAQRLNDEGHATRRGKAFHPVQVKRLLERGRADSGQG